MRRLGLSLLAFVAASVLGGNPSAEAADFGDYELGDFYSLAEVDEAIVHEASAALIRFPSATGFLVDPDGLILTNHHVYESFGERGTVWRRWVGDGSEEALTVELVTKNREHDVALYRVVDPAKPLPFLELRDTQVKPGEQVFVLGHPDGDPLRASFGTVLADNLHIAGRPSIEYSAQTWWGSSGSPVIDERGRVVAIHWGWDLQGSSNGRLTGVPATKFTKLAGFDALGELDSGGASAPVAGCAPTGWSLASTLIDAAARQNSGGRALDRVELRAVHERPSCEDQLRSATFHLHPTFHDPVKTVSGKDALTIYSWGFFDATIVLTLDDGSTLSFRDRVAWK